MKKTGIAILVLSGIISIYSCKKNKEQNTSKTNTVKPTTANTSREDLAIMPKTDVVAVLSDTTDQNLRSYTYGRHTLIGRVILKNLVHPISGKTIKNAMVFVLPKSVKFISDPTDEDSGDATTKEISIYGDLTEKYVDPNVKYKELIGEKVAITANYVFAPSSNYPLEVNIIEDFTYKIL